MKKLILALLMTLSTSVFATQPTGKISSISFYGSGASEVIFVTIEPKVSACPYAGRYMMYTKERPAITSALIAAFHAQSTVQITGTGKCHEAWTNDEVMELATFYK